MKNNNTIHDELKDISPLLIEGTNVNPYAVPPGYFTDIAGSIVEKIRMGAEPEYFFVRDTPYSTPPAYFETLAAILVQQIVKKESNSVFDEMEGISPLLNTISKKPVYAVPKGYLEKVEWQENKVTPQKAKVVSFKINKKILLYVAAAVVIGFLAIGMFLFTGKPITSDQAETAKATLAVKKLSEQEIIDFLKTTSPADNMASTISSTNNKDNVIKNSVSQMSDNEIQQFLQENGETDEM